MTMKEINESFDSRMTGDPLSFETKLRDENHKDIDEISMIDIKKDSDSKEKKQIRTEHENSAAVKEFTPYHENEYQDSISQRDGSDLFETVTNVFTDKNVLECELPELEVMKDICIDNGMLEKDKNLLERSEDDKSAHMVSQCEMKDDEGRESVDQETVKASSVSSPEKDDAAKKSSEEYSMQIAVKTFLDSLDGEMNKTTQPSDQIPIEKTVSEGPAESSSEAVGGLGESGKNIPLDFADAVQVQCTSSSSSSITSLDEQSLVVKDKGPDNSGIQCDNSKSADGCHVRSPSDQSQCSTNDGAPAVDPNDAKYQHDHGEASFSAVTYTGPIAFSGSLSHRSDASTTSTRSFAFPVLQSEWNSSPVRMAKADRRHFRKRKGWRSGLLCCRF